MNDDILAKAEALSGMVKALDDLPGGKVEYRQVYREMVEIFPELVAEVKRLHSEISDRQIIMDCRKETIEEQQEELAAKDAEIKRLQKMYIRDETAYYQICEQVKLLANDCRIKDAELARWREIAIDERARGDLYFNELIEYDDYDYMCVLLPGEMDGLPFPRFSAKDIERSRNGATKELEEMKQLAKEDMMQHVTN